MASSNLCSRRKKGTTTDHLDLDRGLAEDKRPSPEHMADATTVVSHCTMSSAGELRTNSRGSLLRIVGVAEGYTADEHRVHSMLSLGVLMVFASLACKVSAHTRPGTPSQRHLEGSPARGTARLRAAPEKPTHSVYNADTRLAHSGGTSAAQMLRGG